MGDRGNIVVRNHEGNDIWLYGHWWGSELPMVAQQALLAADAGRGSPFGTRWDDAPYLASYVFRAMDDGTSSKPACQISNYMPDNEYRVIVMDTRDLTVRLLDYDGKTELDQHWDMSDVAESQDVAGLLGWGDDDEED